MDKEIKDMPLSETSVTYSLADIQKRCSQILDDADTLSELTLEEVPPSPDDGNPYSRG